MTLTDEQRRSMIDDGYLVVRQCVPRDLVDRARQAINHSLGNVGLPPDKLPEMRARSYCTEIAGEAVITDLASESPLFEAGEALLGPGNLKPMTWGQVALRFPSPPGTEPKAVNGHLDGIGTGINGIEKGDFRRDFTMLAVVLLSHLPEPFAGNFTVWPGTHTFFEGYFREHGWGEVHQGLPKDQYPREPVQVTGEPGDVCFAHHATVHAAFGNFSPNIRYAAIFRLRHVDVETIGKAALTDIWREWEGLGVVGTA